MVRARHRRHPRDPVDPPEPDRRPVPRPRRPAERHHAGPRLRRDRDRDRDRHRALPLPHGSFPPPVRRTRARSSTRSRRRSSTRRCSGACCSASCSDAGLQPNLANLIQALIYALATRLGAPGRPWYMLVTALAIGLAGGWLVGITGGIGAAFLGHAITRVAIFLTTGHSGLPKAKGTEERGARAAAGDAQGLARARLRRGVPRPVARRPLHGPGCHRPAAAGRALCPRAVLRLAVPVLRLRRVRGGRGARTAGPRRGLRRGAAAEIDLRADAADAAFGASRPPLETLYLGGGTPTLLRRRRRSRPSSTASGARFGLAAGAEVTIEANPGPDERGDARGAASMPGVTRVSLGAQSFDDGLLRRLGRRHRPRDVEAAVAEAREAGIGSVSLDLLYDVPGQSRRLGGDAGRRARALAGPRLGLRADPRRPGCGGADRAGRATTCRRARARVAGGRRRSTSRTRTGRPRNTASPSSASTRPASAATRSRTGRGPGTRAATTSPTGSAARTRRSGPGRTRSMGRAPLERGAARRLPAPRSRPPTGRSRGCRPAASRRSMRRRPRSRRRSSGCGSTRGSPSPTPSPGRSAPHLRGRSSGFGGGRSHGPPTTRPSRTSCSALV